MNENQIYLSYMPEDDDSPIDIKDIFAYMLLRWKLILLSMILFAVLGLGIAFLRAKETTSITDQLASARGKLSEETATDLESLHDRMLAYQIYQQHLQDDYAHYVTNAAKAENYILLRVSYYLSSSIDHLDELLSATLLSEEDYVAMRAIAPDDSSLSTIYDRVTITTSANLSSGSDNTVVNITSEEGYRASDYLFLITLYGESEEQCNQLLTVIDAALERSIESFKKLDPNIQLVSVEKQFSSNTRDYIQKQINKNMTVLNSIETQRTNANNNRISKLLGDEKTYYDLLVKSETEDLSADQSGTVTVSRKKWLVIGALAGAFLALAFILLCYLFDGILKIPAEAEQIFHKKTLQRVSLPGKKNLFGKAASALTGADQTPLEVKTEMIAADLQLLLQKSQNNKIYFICNSSDNEAVSVAEAVKTRLSKESKINVEIGNPVASVSELNKFSDSENAIIITELKQSKSHLLSQWQLLCERHKTPVIGIISTERCW